MRRFLSLLLAAAILAAVTGCTGGVAGTPPPGAAETRPAPSPTPEDSAAAVLFQDFLNGGAAVVGDDFANELVYICDDALDMGEPASSLDGVSRITLPELLALVVKSPADTARVQVSYALLENGSGRELLVVRFSELGIYMEGSSDSAYFIFAAEDGEVRLTYAIDSWARRYVELREDLTMVGDSSGGAGDHTVWMGHMDDTGHYCTVYELRTLTSDWIAGYAWDIFGTDTGWCIDCVCYLLTTAEGQFYQMEPTEQVDQRKLATFVTYLEDRGMTPVDDVEAVISDTIADFHIRETPAVTGWTPWTTAE